MKTLTMLQAELYDEYSKIPRWRFIKRYKMRSAIEVFNRYWQENLIPDRWAGETLKIPFLKSKSESEE